MFIRISIEKKPIKKYKKYKRRACERN